MVLSAVLLESCMHTHTGTVGAGPRACCPDGLSVQVAGRQRADAKYTAFALRLGPVVLFRRAYDGRSRYGLRVLNLGLKLSVTGNVATAEPVDIIHAVFPAHIVHFKDTLAPDVLPYI